MVTPTENTLFNHCTRLPNPRAGTANSGAFHERYHYPTAAGSSQSSPSPAHYAPFSNDQRVYPRVESGRAAFKRKNTSAFPAYQNDHGQCSSWISADPQNNFQLKPVPEFCCPQPFTGIAISYPSDNLLYAGEPRNVRSRHGDASPYPAWQSSSSNPPHQLYPLANNFSPNVVGQGCHPLPGSHAQWIHPTGTGCSSYTMNQFVAGNALAGGNARNHGAFHHSLSPASHYSMYRGSGAGPSRYSHRQIPRRTSSSYPNLPFKDTAPLGAASIPLPRYPMPLARNGGLRISNEAQHLFDEENDRVRWTSQVPDMMDGAPYFNPLDLVDEHRNLRLDIDAMSYEELLALEERIGNVNTGLSEDDLPSCLTANVYCSSAADQEDLCDASCPICLEEYKDDDSLGKMKCLHVYHVSCIKEWLRIKNACPICKAPALDDDTLKKS